MFDEDVAAALRHASVESPADLIDILAFVDARQRLVLTLEELNSSLRELIANGRARQVVRGCYAAGLGSTSFEPVLVQDYDAAVSSYKQSFADASEDEPDEIGDVVVLRIDTRETEPTEAELDEFTDALEARLGQTGDILGFELGRDVIELHVAVEGPFTPEVASTISGAARASRVLANWTVLVQSADGQERAIE